MPTIKITDATVEPITLAQAKAQCKVDGDEEDELLSALITTVRQACEHECGRTMLLTTWENVADRFRPAIKLQWPTVLGITSVNYIDPEGVERTVHPGDYMLDAASEPGCLAPAYGRSWPATRTHINAVRVRYTAGYGTIAASVPAPLKQWMLLHLAHYHANREATISGTIISPLPYADRLLDCGRVWGA